MKIRVGTYNIGTREPSLFEQQSFDLSDWLLHDLLGGSGEKDASKPDIIAVGFQELIHQIKAVWTSPSQYSFFERVEEEDEEPVFSNSSPSRRTPTTPQRRKFRLQRNGDSHVQGLETWMELCSKVLIPLGYAPLIAARRAAIGLLIYVRVNGANKSLANSPGTRTENETEIKVLQMAWGSLGTGLLGFYGNKGAVGISLSLSISRRTLSHSSSPTVMSTSLQRLCFLTAHMGPHEGHKNYLWRNEEVESLLTTLVMNRCYLAGTGRTGSGGYATTDSRDFVIPEDHDLVVLCGDLNYRLKDTKTSKGTPDRPKVLEFIAKGNTKALLDADECILSRKSLSHAFWSRFEEGVIQFLPTYKVQISKKTSAKKQPSETSLFTNPNEQLTTKTEDDVDFAAIYSKKRLPAYCDRILYWAPPPSLDTPIASPRGSFSDALMLDPSESQALLSNSPTSGSPRDLDSSSLSFLSLWSNFWYSQSPLTIWPLSSPHVSCTLYTSKPQYTWSDHIPVICDIDFDRQGRNIPRLVPPQKSTSPSAITTSTSSILFRALSKQSRLALSKQRWGRVYRINRFWLIPALSILVVTFFLLEVYRRVA